MNYTFDFTPLIIDHNLLMHKYMNYEVSAPFLGVYEVWILSVPKPNIYIYIYIYLFIVSASSILYFVPTYRGCLGCYLP